MAAPKPLGVATSPSLGPAAARVAAQDAQIAQLVQQSRTLEDSLAQQRDELHAEKTRGIDAVNQIKDRWKAERKEWRDGCDALQAKHRLAHLGTRVTLEHERGLRLEDREALTREKIATLLREHKITLFQARETELVAYVAALEDEIKVQREQLDQILTQHEAEIAGAATKLAQFEARWHEGSEELRESALEKQELEEKVTALHTSSASYSKQVDRLTLLVETLSAQKAAAETHNRDLQHQVDKWQSLEGKSETEAEALRKRRVELEVRVKELEVSLKAARGFEKKAGKLEASLLEVQEQVEQGQRSIAEAQAEADQARKHAAKFEKQVAKLQAALDAEKTRSVDVLEKEKEKRQGLSKPASGAGPRVPAVILEVSEDSEAEIIQEPPAKPRTRDRKPASTHSDKPDTKGKARAKAAPLPIEATDEPQRNKGKEKAQQSILGEGELIEDEDEVQETLPPVKKRGRPRRQEQDSEIEEVPPPPQKNRLKVGQSRRSDDDTEATNKSRSKPGKGKGVDDDELPKKRARDKPASTSGGQGAAKPSSLGADAEEDEGPQKKKKRKLNLAGGANIFAGSTGFSWNQSGEGDLGIPSVLSPVKDAQPVPSRSSVSSSLLGGWKVPWA